MSFYKELFDIFYSYLTYCFNQMRGITDKQQFCQPNIQYSISIELYLPVCYTQDYL